jgi:antitoxin (DNA-binding transcriptional repressor) of toxin-antitoxin stability system
MPFGRVASPWRDTPRIPPRRTADPIVLARRGGYDPPLSTRPVPISELSGPAAEAVEAARRGETVTVTADGEAVARIVPFGDALDRQLAKVAGRFKAKGPLRPAEIDEAIGDAVGR